MAPLRFEGLSVTQLQPLGNRGLLNDEMAGKLAQMEQLLLSLKIISEKELRGENLTEKEYTLIRHIGDTLEDLTTFSEEVEGEIEAAKSAMMDVGKAEAQIKEARKLFEIDGNYAAARLTASKARAALVSP